MSLTVLKCKCAILFGESGRIAPHIIIRLCVKTVMFFQISPRFGWGSGQNSLSCRGMFGRL